MARLLLIDDDAALLRVLTDYLKHFDYEILTADTGAAGLELARSAQPDLVVLDVTMPGMDGLEVLRTLRHETDVPVVMLTALAGEVDVLTGFGLGADDYVSKPFSVAQLEARIRAILSRAEHRPRQGSGVLSHGDLIVELDTHRVRRRGEPVKLTPTEFKLLVTLMEHPGRVLPAEELVVRVWGKEYAGQVDYVRRYIWYLRQKIEDDAEAPRYIQNERNVGYYFAEEAAEPPQNQEPRTRNRARPAPEQTTDNRQQMAESAE